MRNDEALNIVGFVCSVWPAPEMTAEAKAVYAASLLDLEAAPCQQALAALARTETWRPSPAHVRSWVATALGAVADADMVVAAGWSQVLAGERPTDPLCLQAARQLGGVSNLMRSTDPARDRERFARIVRTAVEARNKATLASDGLRGPDVHVALDRPPQRRTEGLRAGLAQLTPATTTEDPR